MMTLEQRMDALEALVVSLMAEVELLKRPTPQFVWGQPPTVVGVPLPPSMQQFQEITYTAAYFPGPIDYTLCAGKK